MRPLLTISLALAAGPLHPAGSAAQAGEEATLQPGDQVRIEVWQKPELSGEFRVAPDGSIVHPLYREVNVAGIPVAEAESRVMRFLSEYEGPSRITFQPLFQVFVGGEVLTPGVRGVGVGTTIAEAISGAGGLTRVANAARVALIRSNRRTVINLADPASPSANQPVRSGDQIVVPARRNLVSEVLVPISSVSGAVLALISLLLR